MGKALTIIGGIAAIAFGIMLFSLWKVNLIMGIKFCVALALILGGGMLILYGIIEIKDSIELKKLEQAEKKE